MATTATRKKAEAAPSGIYVATAGWSGRINDDTVTIGRGGEYAADHPAVVARPELFVAHGQPLPPADLPEAFEPPAPVDAVVNSNPVLDAVMLRRDLRVQIHGGPILELPAGTLSTQTTSSSNGGAGCLPRAPKPASRPVHGRARRRGACLQGGTPLAQNITTPHHPASRPRAPGREGRLTC